MALETLQRTDTEQETQKFCRKYHFKETDDRAVLLKTVFNKSIPEAYLAHSESQHTDNILRICSD